MSRHEHEASDIAGLYHMHSSNSRHRLPDLSVDMDSQPLRFRTYVGSQRIDLPGKDFKLPVDLGSVLCRRRSSRDFVLRTLEASKLGQLLHMSYGIRGSHEVEGQLAYERPAPSAGGLYPLELYVATQQLTGIPDGIYHYDARAHQLELMHEGLFHRRLADITIGQDMIRSANVVVMISAVFQRTMWKYGQRGYRYVLLDAGHVGQNIYLIATALGLGVAAIGGFYDDEVSALIGLPAEEGVIYLMCVGQI